MANDNEGTKTGDNEGISHPEGVEVDIVDLGNGVTFGIPKGHRDKKIRYELPDGTRLEWENPNGDAEVDPNTEPAIWDPVAGKWIPWKPPEGDVVMHMRTNTDGSTSVITVPASERGGSTERASG